LAVRPALIFIKQTASVAERRLSDPLPTPPLQTIMPDAGVM
jgi:hypothetical protein